MNREKAIEILGVTVFRDNSIADMAGETLHWNSDETKASFYECELTAEQLKALAWWMETYGETND